MGNCCLPIRFRRTPSAVNPKNVTLLLLGLDNSGKTTIVKRLAGEPIDSVVPTVGFSVILLRQKGCHVSIYDLGGGPQIRDIWPRYYADAHGIIFVTDAQDIDRMEECRHALETLLRNDQISGKPVLVLANKQDLDGALDEIDIVDRLNLEKVVNEQKCPTLVELCSALNFSKKIDVGIENGYKWLIRSIIRDYPTLNNRVLKDLAQQEAENKVQVLNAVRRGGGGDSSPFRLIKRASFQEEKVHLNGYINSGRKSRSGIKTIAVIPGLIEEDTFIRKSRQGNHFPEAVSHLESFSTGFFTPQTFQSDLELLNDVPNHSLKNFLVRPKSSGARLYGARSEKKRTLKRKPLRKGNKTGPSPFTDISNALDDTSDRHNGFFEGVRRENLPTKPSVENVNPFVTSHCSGEVGQETQSFEMKVIEGSKSVPNSRRNSLGQPRRRRYSMANGKLPSSVCPSAKEILLDVTKLSN